VLRIVVGAAAVATALSLGPLAGPGQAARASDPLDGVAVHPEWGSIAGQGGVLKRGCRTYSFTYTITPPEGAWVLEVFIKGPGMDYVAGGAYFDGYDPLSGTGHYKLCKMTNPPGRYTIDAKVAVEDGAGVITEGRLPTDTYRLRRPHRGHH
jgi:hypothetical protein